MHICRNSGIFNLADVGIFMYKMAGKVNTKAKGRDDKGKANKGVSQNNEDTEDLDFALLRKPIQTSITGFAQARKIFDLATEELKGLLSNECDLLYECKVCRNIFRSLANYISHKRVYCKEKFNTSVHGHFIKSSSTVEEIIKITRTENGYQDALLNKNRPTEADEDDRIPMSKDLTAIVENITKVKGVKDSNDDQQVTLQKIPSSSVAVFQNLNLNEEKEDNMRAQVKEIGNILSRDKAVLQEDGNFVVESSDLADTDSVIQISDDDENEESDALQCKICSLQFSTQKTLRFHMKYKHLESRLVYPCPDCLEIFSTSWSVYRHLFKVHRKTAAQIRRLRESIQAKAFRMNNPPAFYEKRKNNMKVMAAQKITEEERLDQENQAWMDSMEGDGEVPRCGGCGRTFERRAALQAHTHTCPPRSRALRRDPPPPPPPPPQRRIEIQIRKDYHKGPGPSLLQADNKAPSDERPINKTQKEDDQAPDTEKQNEEEEEMDVDIEDDQKSNDSLSPEKTDGETIPIQENYFKPAIGLPFAIQAEKSNLAVFKQRIQKDVHFLKILCKICNIKYDTVPQLFEHMSEHFKWMRYGCKLCNFKHYFFEKVPEHVVAVHKLKGDTDFYYSTVKAIDGTEAMLISKCLSGDAEEATDNNNTNENSPESRRASRCSSDSSRLSDDSTSSTNVKVTGSRKRKIYQNKSYGKRKKQSNANDNGDEQKEDRAKVFSAENESSSSTNIKAFEENSSDMDDIEEKVTKKTAPPATASRRPVRNKTKRKNADFEYDLSNLLKLEAQGYRESLTVSVKTQSKKKSQQDTFEIVNRDYCGALSTLSKMAIDKSQALMKPCTSITVLTVEKELPRPSIFARPSIPRLFYRGEKMSPKKDTTDEIKEEKVEKKITCPNKGSKTTEPTADPKNEIKSNNIPRDGSPASTESDDTIEKCETSKNDAKIEDKVEDVKEISNDTDTPPHDKIKTAENNALPTNEVKAESKTDDSIIADEDKDKQKPSVNIAEKLVRGLTVPPMVPLKFRRQSLEVMKNHPVINKTMTDFTKAGVKTKILLIKPINRNKDGSRSINSPLKFQTIKLKDPNKGSTSCNDKTSDQVVVVKVPKVDRPSHTVTGTVLASNEKSLLKNKIGDQSCENVKNLSEEGIVKTTIENSINTDTNKKCESSDINNSETNNVTSDLVSDSIIESVNNTEKSESEPIAS